MSILSNNCFPTFQTKYRQSLNAERKTIDEALERIGKTFQLVIV